MLTIRKEQIDKLNEIRHKTFVLDMMHHVRLYFPKESESYDDMSLEEFIIKTISKAKYYELESERDICKFINLVMIFGLNLDENPETIWVNEMLRNKSEPNPVIRLNECYKEAIIRIETQETSKK